MPAGETLATHCRHLLAFIDCHADDPSIHGLKASLDSGSPDAFIRACEQVLPRMEAEICSGDVDTDALSGCQAAYRELEYLVALKGNDSRHRFVVVIPVADRPRHLEQCLDSLLELCDLYGYGGKSNGRYNRVSVVVAEDSREDANAAQHARICAAFTARGLHTEHFSREQQRALLMQTRGFDSGALERITGTQVSLNACGYGHKGAAITRNITLLRLRRMTEECADRVLFHFIDSDQQFRVNAPGRPRGVCAINYFHHLDRIFSRSGVSVLTGKVVGDPPVSPAVMANHFIDDVAAFLETLATHTPGEACRFHGHGERADDASYHDMAELFGFENHADTFRYECPLEHDHDHRACLEAFARRLNGFFYGEHPTRSTTFSYAGSLSGTVPARTVYTGNYIFGADGFEHFIPFAMLKLRMAGPVLGRLLKAGIGEAFVSANLPMLHERTVEDTGQSECRPGVNADGSAIDLSDEYERQFFGDVMLFTIEKLTGLGYPQTTPGEREIQSLLDETAAALLRQYRGKHADTLHKLDHLKTVYSGEKSWWNDAAAGASYSGIADFIRNIEHNFGVDARGYAMIASEQHRRRRLEQVRAAIAHLRDDADAWQQALQ